MEQFRATYDTSLNPDIESFAVEVIGYHLPHNNFYASKGCLNNYRVMMFHEPIEVSILGQMSELPPNSLVVFNSMEPSCYGSCGGESWTHSWIRMTGSYVPVLLADCDLRCQEPVLFESFDESDRWLKLIHEEMQRGDETDFLIVRHLVTVWLRQIRRKGKAEGTAQIPEGFRRARAFIEMHFTETLALSELAKVACMSRSHFCDGFGRHYGMPPMAYARRQRMRHATHLMEDVNLSISEVADLCGFRDVYHFSRVFKQHYGISPTKYRRGDHCS